MKYIKEFIYTLKSLEKDIKELEEHYADMKELRRIASENSVCVEFKIPDNIKFVAFCNELRLTLNNQNITDYKILDNSTLMLVKCKREHLKAKDIAFRTDGTAPDFGNLEHYCVILDEKEYVYIENSTDTIVCHLNFNDWYKVVRV